MRIDLANIQSNRIFLVIYSLSLILFAAALLQSRLLISPFGIIDGINPVFFISVILMIVSFILLLKINPRSKLLYLVLFSIYISLCQLAFFLEGTPRFTYSYLTYGYIDFVIRNGFVDNALLVYLNWPGLMYLGAITSILAGISGQIILLFYPFLLKILILCVIFLIIRKISERIEVAWMGVLVYLVGDWTAQFYFTPPALGIFLFLLIYYLVLCKLSRSRIDQLSITLLLIVCGCGLAITHFLTSIVMLIGLVILWIISHFFQYSNRLKMIILLYSVIIAIWIIYPVGNFFSKNITNVTDQLFNIFGVISDTEKSVSGSGIEHADVLEIKIVYTVLFALISVIGCAIVLSNRENWKSPQTLIPLFTIVGISSVTPLIMGSYGGEIISRSFAYVSPFLSFFIAINWGKKLYSVIIICLLLASPFFYVLTAYGNEKMDYVSPEEFSGTSFSYHYFPHDTAVYSFNLRIWPFKYIEEMRWKPMNATILMGDQDPATDYTPYAVLNERDIDSYTFLNFPINRERLQDQFDTGYGKIYTTDKFIIYLKE